MFESATGKSRESSCKAGLKIISDRQQYLGYKKKYMNLLGIMMLIMKRKNVAL